MELSRVVYNVDENYLALMEDIELATLITIDIETSGLNPYGVNANKICGVAFRFPNTSRNRYYVPVRHEPHYIDGYDAKDKPIIITDDPLPYNLPMKDYIKILDSLDECKIQRGYNYKFDLAFLRKDGMELPKKIEDPMLMAYLCNENEKNFKLKDLSVKYLGPTANKSQLELHNKLKQMGFKIHEMYKLYPSEVAPYAMDDVLLTDMLYDFYVPHINVWGLQEMMQEYFDYEMVVHMMEYKGMRVDPVVLKQRIHEAYFTARDIKAYIIKQVGYEINLNSPKQVCAWLGIQSSAMDILEEIIAFTKDENKKKNIQLLLEYKSWMKVHSTYYNKFEDMMDENNVIHATFFIIGTVSGRLSCKNPNLQALPRENKVKGGVDLSHIYKVKNVFIASEGNVIISSDLSQAELRLGAVRANVSALKDKIYRGVDVHTETGEDIGIPRYQAKTINFSIFYGIGAEALSKKLGISLIEAKSILRKYHDQHPEIRSYSRELEARARAHGYIRMFTGKVKRFPRKEECHKAVSSDVQGGVAELMRIAMLRLHKLGYSQYLVNQIHDDLVFDAPKEVQYEIADALGTVLTTYDVMEDLPMETDTKIGPNWGEMIKYGQN